MVRGLVSSIAHTGADPGSVDASQNGARNKRLEGHKGYATERYEIASTANTETGRSTGLAERARGSGRSPSADSLLTNDARSGPAMASSPA
jgi:hypothetical protein